MFVLYFIIVMVNKFIVKIIFVSVLKNIFFPVISQELQQINSLLLRLHALQQQKILCVCPKSIYMNIFNLTITKLVTQLDQIINNMSSIYFQFR